MKVSDIYPWLKDYILSKKGVTTDYKEEWDWTRFLIRNKQFAAFCGESGERALFTVKCDPTLNFELRQLYEDIIPGYYCNKEHWNSVELTGTVPDDVIKTMVDSGYTIVLNSFSKKVRAEILSEE